MKILVVLTGFCCFFFNAFTQVAISSNAAVADANTMLDIKSNNKGVKFPRLTTAQRKAIAVSVADAGLMVFDTDKQTLYMYDGYSWQPFATASTAPAAILKKTYPAPGTHTAYRFGLAVALEADHAVVSAPEDSASGLSSAGSVFTYKKINGVWQQQQRLTAPVPGVSDQFGYSLSISGNQLAIGAVTADGAYNSQGAVYIYSYNGSSWEYQQKITAGDPGVNAYFGYTLKLKGSTLLVGSTGAKVGNNLLQGAVYFFQKTLNGWSQQIKLTAPDGTAEAAFGCAVDFDGDYVAVGAHSAVTGGVKKGAVYIFVNGGGTYTMQQKLFSANGNHNAYFGTAVSLEGSNVLIGASAEILGNATCGRAFLYSRTAAVWAEKQSFVPVGSDNDMRFGGEVKLKDGYIIIGANQETANNIKSGKLYIYKKIAPYFQLVRGMVPDDAENEDNFAYALDFDGSSIIASAYFKMRQAEAAVERGVVYFGSVD